MSPPRRKIEPAYFSLLTEAELLVGLGSWHWRIADDDVIWSPGLYAIFQRDPALPAPNWQEHPRYYVAEDFEPYTAVVRKCLEDGEPYQFDLRAIRSDGEIRHCVARGKGHRDDRGEIIAMSGTLQDITDQRNAAWLLAMAERIGRLGGYHTRVPAGEWTGSEQFCRMFGFRAGVPHSVEEFEAIIHPDDRDAVLAYYAECLAGRKRFDHEFRAINRLDQRVIHVRSISEVVYAEDGSPREILGVKQDITERKHLEREREGLRQQLIHAAKHESLVQLAGGVAHDLNNLLVAIQNNAELLLDSCDSISDRESLADIVAAASDAAAITKQLVTFSGQTTAGHVPVRLDDTMQTLRKLVETTLPPGVRLRFSLEETPETLADPTQLRQLILNLVFNAAQASESTGGVVLLRTSALEIDAGATDADPQGSGWVGVPAAPGRYATLVVTDEGEGMDAETAARAFDPFFSTKGGGRGLGLSSVLGIVRAHGGYLRLTTARAIGTTITVAIPASEIAP